MNKLLQATIKCLDFRKVSSGPQKICDRPTGAKLSCQRQQPQFISISFGAQESGEALLRSTLVNSPDTVRHLNRRKTLFLSVNGTIQSAGITISRRRFFMPTLHIRIAIFVPENASLKYKTTICRVNLRICALNIAHCGNARVTKGLV